MGHAYNWTEFECKNGFLIHNSWFSFDKLFVSLLGDRKVKTLQFAQVAQTIILFLDLESTSFKK